MIDSSKDARRILGRSFRKINKHDVVFYAPRMTPLLSENEDPSPGGAETQIFLLARELAAQGHRVALVVRKTNDRLPDETGRVKIISQPAVHSGPQLFRSARNAVATLRALWPLDAAVFVQRAAGRETGLVAIIAKVRQRRFIYSSANVIDFEFDRLEPRRANVALFHLGVRLADRIVVQTAEQDELCRGRFNRIPIVIKSLAEPAARRIAQPEAFLWVGRLTSYKRPLAFISLARALPEAHFWMVVTGEGQAAGRFRREIDEASQELENLEVLAPRPRPQLARLIERAVAMVNTADYEGMPNVFLEAWSRGVPALALSHDPDGVIARERLGGFAEGDPDRLVELAQQLWNERDHQQDLALRCLCYTNREHAPGIVAARWAVALGLAGPMAAPESQASRYDGLA
jgi:glycosyltransferase involved in cell wall biosynthesis